MRRKQVLRAGIMALLFVVAAPSAAHAQSVTCVSPVAITDFSDLAIAGGAGATVVTFDFIGNVTHCLADGTRVPGAIAGSAVQVIRADGSGTVVVRETLTIPTGTLDFVALARFTPSSFAGTIHTTSGTGALSRVHGRGTFFPTAPPTGPVGPTAFLSTVVYEYY